MEKNDLHCLLSFSPRQKLSGCRWQEGKKNKELETEIPAFVLAAFEGIRQQVLLCLINVTAARVNADYLVQVRGEDPDASCHLIPEACSERIYNKE